MTMTRGHTVTSGPDRRLLFTALASTTLALLALATGCVPELGCEELGCDPGKVCNTSSGECVDRACTPESCPAGERCNQQTGACEPISKRCGPGHPPCSSGETCNMSAETANSSVGICEPDTDCAAQGCTSPVETCDTDSGECVPKSCDDHSDCTAPGYICGTTGTCTSGCLLEEQNCPTGQNCNPVSGDTTVVSGSKVGRCLQTCQSNQECPHGSYCPQTTCTPEPPCDADDDCPREDEVCRNGRCDAPPCRSNDDCPSEQYCDHATGVCLGANCADDNFAPNYTWADAAEIAFDTFRGLQLCRGRSDWFSLPTGSSEAVRIRLEHAVEHDLDLMVYNEDGRVIGIDEQAPPPNVDRGQFVSSSSFVSNREQTVRIRIFSHRREESSSEASFPLPETASYELKIENATDSFCSDDPYEENDTRSAADRLPSDVGAEPQYDFQICGDDLDWYKLADLPAYSKFQTQLVGVDDQAGHLRYSILSAHGRQFTLTPDQALTLLRTGPLQDWYLLVYSRTNSSASYGIRYKIAPPYECPEAGQHSEVEQALPLAPRIATTYQLCPLDDAWETDWVALQSPETNARMELMLTPEASGDLPELDVSLFEKQPGGLRLLRNAAHTDRGYELALETRPDQRLVLRVGSDAEARLLRFEPKYKLRYAFESN